METLALDTTFLIDLQNDRRGRGAPSGAETFLRQHSDVVLCLPAVARGEYLEGFEDVGSVQALALIGGLRVLAVDEDVAVEYALQARRLRHSGRIIGANDLWIGCTAKRYRLPILTHNIEAFARINGLEVVDYTLGAAIG